MPGAAACLVHYASQPEWWPGFQHVGVLAAAGVGLLIAAQAGWRAWLWPLGLALGAGAGWLDLRAFDVCYSELDWSLANASYMPVWGWALGFLAGVANPGWVRTFAAPLLGALSDLGARWAWASFVDAELALEARAAWGDAMWLLASQTYLVPALVVTACAGFGKRAQLDDPAVVRSRESAGSTPATACT